MAQNVTLEDLQGSYDISYQSTPQIEDLFEPGFGAGEIRGSTLTGMDGLGVVWNAEINISNDGMISYEAVLDPTTAPPTVVLVDKTGNTTREPQQYAGKLNVTKSQDILILRTYVQQGPIRIDVQFRKR